MHTGRPPVSLSRGVTRRALAIVTITIVVAALLAAWQGAARGGETGGAQIAPHGIVVVGDSITARYNDDPGHPEQGWWSIVARHHDTPVTTYAQSGSGYLRPGQRCAGDRFIDRPEAYTGAAPSILIVEGGRNDWARCVGGRLVPAPDAMIERAVDRYLDVVQTFLPPTTRIVVLAPPWGPVAAADGERVTSIVREVAERHGLLFVDMDGALPATHVIDGVHPNRAGSEAIAARVLDALR